jgi:hypothetical protein
MAFVGPANWRLLDTLLKGARNQLELVSPFVTRDGLRPHLWNQIRAPTIELTTRISAVEWAAGTCDIEAIVDFARKVSGDVRLHSLPNLHAKVYAADGNSALVGSANLTAGGFARNVEAIVEFAGRDCDLVRDFLQTHVYLVSRPVPVDLLQDWVSEYRTKVKRVARKLRPDATLLQADQALAEVTGTTVDPTGAVVVPGAAVRQEFMDWLAEHPNLPGAQMLTNRAHGLQNLTGHVKQAFYAAFMFYSTRPDLLQPTATQLLSLREADVFSPSPHLQESFAEFVRSSEEVLLPNGEFSGETLRTILPPSFGGTRGGGGGGISTVKRMLPLVAGYMWRRSQPAAPASRRRRRQR